MLCDFYSDATSRAKDLCSWDKDFYFATTSLVGDFYSSTIPWGISTSPRPFPPIFSARL